KALNRIYLNRLSFLFDTTVTQALDLVDRKCISHITSPSGRELYQIQRSLTEFYICLNNCNYCTCASFSFHVLRKGQYMCKHKLATLLSSAMGLCKEVQYSDETVALMLEGEG
ncbi:zinc finger SWIM domain-containing protein 7-like, partial [Stegodyphus dumicola]|uniref:zinc finger SWIM domain-containing protein 7-like n=1 Tax=Stegodyphus dumicola TaxID=202533 RepID=UPI0015AAF355